MLFKQSDTALSLQQENRLKQVRVTMRNAGSYMGKLKMNEGREILTRWETLNRKVVRSVVFLQHDRPDVGC